MLLAHTQRIFRPLRLCVICGFLLFAAAPLAAKPPAAPAEDAATAPIDQQCYEQLFEDYLFDPTGAQWVNVDSVERASWRQFRFRQYGWLKVEDDGSRRIYFADGDSIPVTEETEFVERDFLDDCRHILSGPENEVVFTRIVGDPEDLFAANAGKYQLLLGGADAQELHFAAWLWKLEEPELAEQMFARADLKRRGEWADLLSQIEHNLGECATYNLLAAFRFEDEIEAYVHAQRIVAQYPGTLESDRRAKLVVEELNRRRAERELTAATLALPEDFATWSQEDRIEYLIAGLERVAQDINSYPGAVNWFTDPYVAELYNLGEPAVPALLGVVAHDERLTQSTDGMHHELQLVRVRDVAAWLAGEILMLDQLHYPRNGYNCTAPGPDGTPSFAQHLAEYWEKWGHLETHARWMAILTSDETTDGDKRLAAVALGNVGYFTKLEQSQKIGLPLSDAYLLSHRESLPWSAEVIETYSEPTAAEAILAAMECRDYHAQYMDGEIFDLAYLAAIVAVGDDRICGELVRRCEFEPSPKLRRHLAFTAWCLGDDRAWNSLARDVERGNLRLTLVVDGEEIENEPLAELQSTLVSLTLVGNQASDDALWALTNDNHPFRKHWAENLFQEVPAPFLFPFEAHDCLERRWTMHPACLAILRAQLANQTATGAQIRRRENRVTRSSSGNEDLARIGDATSEAIPPWLGDDSRETARERVCDLAAKRACDLVYGLPRYRALLADRESRLAELAEAIDRYGRDYVPLTPAESAALHLPPPATSRVIVPDFPLLDPPPLELVRLGRFRPALGLLEHAATADDVEANRAIFHLDGQGELLDMQLPALAILPLPADAAENADPERGLLLQAERDRQTGAVTYGILFAAGPQVLSAEEVAEVLPIEDEASPPAATAE